MKDNDRALKLSGSHNFTQIYRVVGRFVQNRARFCPKTCHAEEVTEPICFKFVQDIATYISLHPPKSCLHCLQNNRVVNPNVEATLKKHFAVF